MHVFGEKHAFLEKFILVILFNILYTFISFWVVKTSSVFNMILKDFMCTDEENLEAVLKGKNTFWKRKVAAYNLFYCEGTC